MPADADHRFDGDRAVHCGQAHHGTVPLPRIARDRLTRPRSEIEDEDFALSALEEHRESSVRLFRRNNPTFITCAPRIKFIGLKG